MPALSLRQLATLLACSSGAALAQGLSPLTFEAGYTVQRDDNLFRLPDNADTQALLGRSSAAEQIDIRSLGASFDKSWSLQNLRLNYRVVDYQYQNFSYLNFTALNHELAWRWAVTPRITGTLSSSEQEVLSSYADFQGYSTRNTRTDTNRSLAARAEIDGLWSVQGSLATVQRSNQLQTLAGNDYRALVREAAVQYARPSLSSARLVTRRTEGTYLNRSLPSPGLYDERFTQWNHELILRWQPSGWSELGLSAGRQDRSHPNYPQRDFSGTTGRSDLSLALSGRTRIALGYARELNDYLSSTSSYTVSGRRYARISWQPSNRWQLSFQHNQTALEFRGAVTSVTSTRQDDTRDQTLSASWQADERFVLMASLQRASRASTQTNLAYASHLASLTLQVNL